MTSKSIPAFEPPIFKMTNHSSFSLKCKMERENIFEKNSNPKITTERIEVKIEYDQSENVTDDSSQSEALNVGLISEESGVLTDSGQASEIEFLEVQTGNEASQIDETGKDFFVTNMPSTSKMSQE